MSEVRKGAPPLKNEKSEVILMSPEDDHTDPSLPDRRSGKKRLSHAYAMKLMMRAIVDLSETATVHPRVLEEIREVMRGKL